MATRTDLYTSKHLPYNLLPTAQWEVLRKHEMRYRPTHRRNVTPTGCHGYMQIHIRWGITDKWVFAGMLELPVTNTVMATVIYQGEQFRREVLQRLGPPSPSRILARGVGAAHRATIGASDPHRISRKQRAKKDWQ